MVIHKNKGFDFGLVSSMLLLVLTAFSFSILTLPSASADDSVIDDVEIVVPISCSMSANVISEHVSEVINGQTVNGIGTTTLKVICNDNLGYAIYAIGYTNDEYGNTVLTNPTLGNTHDIITSSTIISSTSSWAMKLTAVSGTYAPIIAGSSLDTLKGQGDPDFSDYTAVPEEYTKVAYYTSSTDTGASANGSSLTTTYRAYVSQSQPAGTYTGKVKYTLVHPADTTAPIAPVSIESAYIKAGKQKYKGYYKMQDMNNTICSMVNVFGESSEAQLIDERDDNVYGVRKFENGKCLMIDNLRFVDSSLSSTSSNVPSDITITWYDFDANGSSSEQCPGANYACKHEGVDDSGNDTVWYSYYGATATISGSVGVFSVCPSGWQLPPEDGSNVINALDPTVFNAVAGGYYLNYTGAFYGANNSGFWWYHSGTATYPVAVVYNKVTGVFDKNSYPKERGFYIRCVAISQ